MNNYELLQISTRHESTVEQVEKLIEHLQEEQKITAPSTILNSDYKVRYSNEKHLLKHQQHLRKQ